MTETSGEQRPSMEDRLRDAILDIDAHATPLGEDGDGFVSGGYLVSVGSLHRALGMVGHSTAKCRYCASGKPCEEFRAEAAEHYQRESLEALADVAGIPHEARANFYLLDDLLDHIGGPGTAETRWQAIREAATTARELSGGAERGEHEND